MCRQNFFLFLLTGLPRYCYTLEVGSKLKVMFDSVKTIQLREDRALGMKFFLIWAMISLQKPLKRVFRVTTPDGTMHTRLLKYERLPTFCFICGISGHRYRDCSKSMEGNLNVNDLAYGPWIGGVDNMISNQLFSLDVSAEGTDLLADLVGDGSGDHRSVVAATIPTSISIPLPLFPAIWLLGRRIL